LDDVENEQDPKSMGLYTWALGHGNPYEAYYHLGLIHAKAARTENALEGKKTGTCGVAVSYLKNMVERGCFEYDMMGEADAAWKRGERVTALIRWWIASEMGYEVAQNNVAFIMDQGGICLCLTNECHNGFVDTQFPFSSGQTDQVEQAIAIALCFVAQ
jgi:hypothetical protein